ncbi:phospholipase [Lasiodiplodia theobromae]|uniref:Phospholipase n=1 Tax=Lasiodiplodia theobromae TaxID=45133 RepID=A0A8H7IRJ2_9PEZI|nr:phospholipase [Lasiodiplodia theobromae]
MVTGEIQTVVVPANPSVINFRLNQIGIDLRKEYPDAPMFGGSNVDLLELPLFIQNLRQKLLWDKEMYPTEQDQIAYALGRLHVEERSYFAEYVNDDGSIRLDSFDDFIKILSEKHNESERAIESLKSTIALLESKLKEKEPESKRQEIRPGLHVDSWPVFKQFVEGNPPAAIQALAGKPKLYWQKSADETKPFSVDSEARVPLEVWEEKWRSGREIPERVRINSIDLIRALRDVSEGEWAVFDAPDNQLENPSVVFLRPYRFFWNYRENIIKKKDELEEKIRWLETTTEIFGSNAVEPEESSPEKETQEELQQTRKLLEDLKSLIRFIETAVTPVARKYRDRENPPQTITFWDLWYLFRPGEVVISRGSNEEDAHALSREDDRTKEDEYMQTGKIFNAFEIQCYRVGFSGTNMGPTVNSFSISHFEGEREINSLRLVPLRCAKDREKLQQQLESIAYKFISVTKPPFCHQMYTGKKYTRCANGAESDPAVEGLGSTPKHIQGSVIVDFASAFKEDARWTPFLGFLDPLAADPVEFTETWPFNVWRAKEENESSKIEGEKKAERQPYRRTIYDEHIYNDSHVNRTIRLKLVSDDPFLSEFQRSSEDECITVEDFEKKFFTDNKLILPETVCAFILDHEADVVLVERGRDQFKENEVCSVFLRKLEYYQGVLFLTTNRVGHIDEAIKSRIHLALHYPNLSEDVMEELIRNTLQRLKSSPEYKSRLDVNIRDIVRQCMKFIREKMNLNLDGGGVRGLSSLLILEKLMLQIDEKNPPKPCDYFDMIGGTSTGGLIAIMLGRLHMDVSTCIEAYNNLMENVFAEEGTHGYDSNQKMQARFDTEALERGIKDLLRGKEDEPFREELPRCKVFVCATSAQNRKSVLFTNYPRSKGTPKDAKIWEAARATSAEPTFFERIQIGRFKQAFLSGSTGANNPVNHLWSEAEQQWGQPLAKSINCLVSIGTGEPTSKAFGSFLPEVWSTLEAISRDAESSARHFLDNHLELTNDPLRYFRFNVTAGLGDVGLEEYKDIPLIASATDEYFEDREIHMKVEQLRALLEKTERNIINILVERSAVGRDIRRSGSPLPQWIAEQQGQSDRLFSAQRSSSPSVIAATTPVMLGVGAAVQYESGSDTKPEYHSTEKVMQRLAESQVIKPQVASPSDEFSLLSLAPTSPSSESAESYPSTDKEWKHDQTNDEAPVDDESHNPSHESVSPSLSSATIRAQLQESLGTYTNVLAHDATPPAPTSVVNRGREERAQGVLLSSKFNISRFFSGAESSVRLIEDDMSLRKGGLSTDFVRYAIIDALKDEPATHVISYCCSTTLGAT